MTRELCNRKAELGRNASISWPLSWRRLPTEEPSRPLHGELRRRRLCVSAGLPQRLVDEDDSRYLESSITYSVRCRHEGTAYRPQYLIPGFIDLACPGPLLVPLRFAQDRKDDAYKWPSQGVPGYQDQYLPHLSLCSLSQWDPYPRKAPSRGFPRRVSLRPPYRGRLAGMALFC